MRTSDWGVVGDTSQRKGLLFVMVETQLGPENHFPGTSLKTLPLGIGQALWVPPLPRVWSSGNEVPRPVCRGELALAAGI